jgi:hypothetical protein
VSALSSSIRPLAISMNEPARAVVQHDVGDPEVLHDLRQESRVGLVADPHGDSEPLVALALGSVVEADELDLRTEGLPPHLEPAAAARRRSR